MKQPGYFIIDFGGTATKALYCEDSHVVRRYCFESEEYECSQTGIRQLLHDLQIPEKQLGGVVVTGGKTRILGGRPSDFNLTLVDEIAAIGIGGLLATKKDSALVVSIGTGTAMVYARKNHAVTDYHIQHMGGLALGGGTIMGLGKLLCNVKTFKELDELAISGQSDKVDLLVGDIVGGDIGIVPAELTASNFGRVARRDGSYSRADVAAGLFTMVGQALARLAIILAKQENIDTIVVIGQVSENAYMQKVFREVQKLFGGNFVFVSNARYRVAEGALALALNQIS